MNEVMRVLAACACALACAAVRDVQAAQYLEEVYADGFDCRTWYPDADGDGFGTQTGAAFACARPPASALRAGDCNDADNTIRPNAVDLPDDAFVDRDCDGIDGAVIDGVFVAADGSDGAAGTIDAPKKTIGAGIAAAATTGKRFVYVAAGSYAEAVAIDAAHAGIGLYGGYHRAANWARDGAQALVSGPRSGALRIDGVSAATTVEYLHFQSAAAATPGASSYAIVVSASSGVTLRHVTADAGNGANGAQGANAGATGDDGGDGTTGAPGFEDDSYFICAGDEPDPALAYAGGTSCTGAVVSNKGGDGHRGCKSDGSSCPGTNGDPGSPDVAGVTGDGGFGAAGAPGGSGQAGMNGGGGGDGAGGDGGAILAGEWVATPGERGANGSDGTGGGGGAGGGSTHTFGTCEDWGGGGGGGGAGGCGGTGGDGGDGGGASIAVLLLDSSVVATAVAVTTGNGGNGGAGRDGGGYGSGGIGHSGGPGNDESKSGGAGANGGHGGVGGNGGGGAGGWVVGVYRSNSTWTDGGSTPSTLGSVGAGGTSSGNHGLAGSSYVIY